MGLFDEVKKDVWMVISPIETILSMVTFLYSIQWKYKTPTMIHSLDECGLKFIDLQTCPILTHSTNPPKNEWPKQWCWLQRQWVCTFLGIMNDVWFHFTLLLRMFWNHINAGRKIQVALCCYVSDLNIRNEGILSLFLKMPKLWLLKCLISN